MSSDLAIAGVTATLRYLLQQGFVDHVKLGSQGPVTVTAKAPDLIKTDSTSLPDQLNLFMYHVSHNAACRNMHLPSRDEAGRRIDNPILALDLHYIVTAYSQHELYADVLLGYAMQFLNEVPILTRQAIQTALLPPPSEVAFLSPADLLDQVDQIKVVPHIMTADEMYKLWMAFQTTYRPSAGYLVSVLLIQNQRPARASLPVLSIGNIDPVTKKPAGVIALPAMTPPVPTLTAAVPPAKQTAVRLGDVLSLEGFHLADAPATILLTHLETGTVVALTPTRATGTALTAPLPPAASAAAASLRAGMHAVSVRLGTGLRAKTTGALPVALAPRLRSMTASGPVSTKVLTLGFEPAVHRGQRVSALIGDGEAFPEAWVGDATSTLRFTFDASSLVVFGQVPVRLRVDGVESILVDRSVDPPAFDPSQQVTL